MYSVLNARIMPQRDDPTEAAVLRVADAVGGAIEFWGFKRPMGRLWTLLYLSQEPQSAQDIGDRLSMSAGAVSMALGELQKWGVVKKAWVPGERREFYEPETSVWKMVSRVFREREMVQITAAIEVFQVAIAELGRRGKSGPTKFMVSRIESLKQLAEVAQMLLGAVLDGQPIDPAILKG
jgi:HTH-type transcriptional regulator, glycine betaine synthesis regulator